ncbi:hypothetical protein EYV94_05455 [Puteibacter caeruleilacunae]|nr:hypothetical protein EYV94_05455 [Puteibacter caeruleilacunae]
MENCKTKILNETKSGKLFRCLSCDKIHIEFQNLYFTFNNEEYKKFKEYFLELDGEYWEDVNKNVICRRRIMVPIGHQRLILLFNNEEIRELKKLFSYDLRFGNLLSMISYSSIDAKVSKN